MRLADLHCDTISCCLDLGVSLAENDLQLDLLRGNKAEEWIQVLALWLDTKYQGEAAFNRFYEGYQYLKGEVEKNSDKIELYQTGKAASPHKCRALLAVEGGHVLGGDFNKIAKLSQLGVAFLTLVWNCDNELASGVYGSDNGLTDFGKEAIGELERQGIVIDISHLNLKGADELLAMAKKPLVATHSNSWTINEHLRNLHDYQLKYLIENQGLCGINFYPVFVNGKDDCTPDDIRRHIDHILSLGGEDILALGSDFDGAPMPTFLGGAEGLYNLHDNVVKWYGQNIADKIFYDNAKSFIEKNIVI